MQPVRGGIGKILSHAAVEMDIHQAGDNIAAGSVQNCVISAGLGNQRAVGADIPQREAPFQVEDLTAGDSHAITPAAISLHKAASSATSTTFLCSWRMEPGHLGVMGPQTEL